MLTVQNMSLEVISPSKSLATRRAGVDLVCAAAAVATCTAHGRVHMDVHAAALVSSCRGRCQILVSSARGVCRASEMKHVQCRLLTRPT